MGDRIVIGFQTATSFDHDTCMYLYCHWAGFDALQRLDQGLRIASQANRLNDTAYLNRICISRITAPAIDHPLGYGLEVGRYPMPDRDHNYVLLSHPLGTKPPLIVVTDNSGERDTVVGYHSIDEFNRLIARGVEPDYHTVSA